MRISCSICDHVFDPHDALERSIHDRKCNPQRRQVELKRLVISESNKQKQFGYSPLIPFQDGDNAFVVHPTTCLGSGSYTSKMTQGMPNAFFSDLKLNPMNPFLKEINNDIKRKETTT